MAWLAAAGMFSVAGLTGCTEAAPSPTTSSSRARLVVDEVAYDCATRTLVISGSADPAREGQGIQVQVRSVERPRAPVWRIATADSVGRFRASGTYAISSGEAIELTVKLASVVEGNRVFSATATKSVTCPRAA